MHDKDGEGIEKLLEKKEAQRRITSLQTTEGLEEMGAPALMKIALPAKDEDAVRQRAMSKPNFTEAGCACVRPVMAVEDFRGHPSPILNAKEIDPAELSWKDIGSGIFARTFVGVSKLPVTSSGGPAECDIYRRIVRSLTTGKVIDDCVVHDVSDEILKGSMPRPDNL